MQSSTVSLIRSNASSMSRRSASFVDTFIERLLAQCPELSPVLAPDPAQRRHEFIETFGVVLRHAASPHALGSRLAVIAAAHHHRGVRRSHYECAHAILLSLLAEFNGAAWSPQLQHGWRDLLDRLLIHLAPVDAFDEAYAA